MRQRSVMRHNFAQVPQMRMQRSMFDRSHGYKTGMNAGFLVPIYCDEALPGDTFNMKANGFGRMATPVYPVMDNIHLETFFFAVPVRLIWQNFKRFMGEQTSPGDTTDYTVPQVTYNGITETSLPDYMGLPLTATQISFNALHTRAYNLIFNEWFRPQDLVASVPVDTDDGPDDGSNYVLARRAKRADYFTRALPFLQKGDEVTVPLGSLAPVIGIGYRESGTTPQTGVSPNVIEADSTSSTNYAHWDDFDKALTWIGDVDDATKQPQIYADLAQSTGVSINTFRFAASIQRLLERDARGGTRYTELVRNHFGVTSPDARQQRPEYLGGGNSYINMHSVPQTGSTDATTPQGNLAAYATFSTKPHGFTHSFTEHCVVIGLANIRADITYQNGIDRMWSRRTRYDYYWPDLSELGEQAIANREIFYSGTAVDDEVFGYIPRYDEYRSKQSKITGTLRSTAAAPLDAWHLSQQFTQTPALNAEFIRDDPPIDRVVAVTDEPHFICDWYFDLKCARPMPMFGVPGMDRF